VPGVDVQCAHMHGADISGALIQGSLIPGADTMLPRTSSCGASQLFVALLVQKQQILIVKTAKPFKLNCYRPLTPYKSKNHGERGGGPPRFRK
jgi:hypothetical protein